MAVPAFTTVVGPTKDDLADGPTGYNRLTTATDANFAMFNSWADGAYQNLNLKTTVASSSLLITMAEGWSFEGGAGPYPNSHRESWGKRYGAVTYISLVVKRTGATIAANSGGNPGNLTDSLVGTLAAGWGPPGTVWLTAISGAGIFGMFIYADGRVYLRNAGGAYAFRNGQLLLVNAMYSNTDLTAW